MPVPREPGAFVARLDDSPAPSEPVAARSGRGVVYLLRVLSTGAPEAFVSALGDKVLNLPAVPGVYLFKGSRGEVLYVGKAKSLAHRVRSYLSGENAHPRLK